MNIHIYTHEQNQNSPTKFKYSRLIQWTKEIKNYLPVKNKTNKHKQENQTKARCQMGNKAIQIKLANMLRGKERKERMNRYAKLNKGR